MTRLAVVASRCFRRLFCILSLFSTIAFLWRTPRPLLSSTVRASPEVLGAIATGAPILALESTVITHGMDYPENLETTRLLESRAKAAGVVPATIAVIRGMPTIGIGDELEPLSKNASDPNSGIVKASRLDLPYVRATSKTAGTTVALTSMLAGSVGISVFATGGIGGAHRFVPSEGSTDILDVSADLLELSRTPVLVVSAGPKAILDLPRTMEILETNSVPVVGYRTDFLPAFWTSESDIRLSMRVENELEAARLARWAAAQGTGMLLANPIPQNRELDRKVVDDAVNAILEELPAKGVRGKEITPYMLRRMKELTDGRSVDANIALIENNVEVASRVACCIAYPEDGVHGLIATVYRGAKNGDSGLSFLSNVLNGLRILLSGLLPSLVANDESSAPSRHQEDFQQCIAIPVYDAIIGSLRNPVLLLVSIISRIPFARRHVDVLMRLAEILCWSFLVGAVWKTIHGLCGSVWSRRRSCGDQCGDQCVLNMPVVVSSGPPTTGSGNQLGETSDHPSPGPGEER